MTSPHKRLALLVVAAAALSACGSTVAASGMAAGAGGTSAGAPDGTQFEGELGTGLDASGGAGTGDPLSGEVRGEQGFGSTTSGTDDASSGTQSGRGQAPGSVPGPQQKPAVERGSVTETSVRIGFYYAEDAQETTRSIGASNDTPSFRDAAEAMITTINSSGGVRGRRILPVFHGIRLTGERSSEDQAACAKFTQDNSVLAVVAVGTNSDQFSACMAKAGVVLVYAGLTINNAETFRRYPLLSEPISINLDRLARVQVDGLAAQGWLQHAAGSDAALAGLPVKLGVIVRDSPSFRKTFETVLKPAYARKGTPVQEEFFVSPNTQEAASDIDAAVLRFAAQNVTHVTFLSTAGTTPGVFMLRATGQRYQPRYGFSSQDAPQVVLPNLPDKKGQLRGALGVGWLPFGDVVNPTDKGVAAPSYQRCLATLRSQSVSPTDANSAGLLAFVCDGFWFLKAAFEAAPAGPLTARGFVAGQESLGTTYAPAAVTSTNVGPDRHDGVGSIRYLAFQEACECYRYTSPPRPV